MVWRKGSTNKRTGQELFQELLDDRDCRTSYEKVYMETYRMDISESFKI